MNSQIATPVAFQGEKGSNTHIALQNVLPNAEPFTCTSFEDVFTALEDGSVEYALIPVENSIAGRVADIHHLLPKADISIIAEHFEGIEHMLLGVPGTNINELTEIHSHVHALGQCRQFLTLHDARGVVHPDTAGAAKDVAQWNDKTKAAIATKLAAEIYGLEILAENIEDTDHNTTRFLLISKIHKPEAVSGDSRVITSIFFSLRSVPAALYKAIGGFATNGINLTRIESYISGEKFSSAQFFVDVEGHPDSKEMQHALEELSFFTDEVKIMGTYPAHSYRFS